jgi:hypothetical protein
VVPIAETLRAESDSFNGRDPGQVLTATATAYQDSWGKGFSTGWAIFTKKVIGRQAVVAYTPGIIMYRTPSLIPYQGIDKFLNVVTYIIPRALWQDKPDLNVGPKFGQDYFRAPHDTENSPAMTVFGEGYIFAGWAGTVLACSILGLLLAFLFQNTVSAGIPIIFLALTPSLVDVEGQFTTISVGIIEKAPIFLVAYWILIKLSNRQNNSTAKNLVKIRTH